MNRVRTSWVAIFAALAFLLVCSDRAFGGPQILFQPANTAFVGDSVYLKVLDGKAPFTVTGTPVDIVEISPYKPGSVIYVIAAKKAGQATVMIKDATGAATTVVFTAKPKVVAAPQSSGLGFTIPSAAALQQMQKFRQDAGLVDAQQTSGPGTFQAGPAAARKRQEEMEKNQTIVGVTPTDAQKQKAKEAEAIRKAVKDSIPGQ